VRVRLALAGIAVAIAGCGTAPPSAIPLASTPAPVVVPVSPGQSAASGPVAIDPSLLDHLPAKVDGLDVLSSAASDAAAAADPVLKPFGEGVVTALAIDPVSGDFAYATLVRLRPNAFSDELYRSWRDSFDEGACSQAGGVDRRAVTQMSGREVHIDSCAGGIRTYHVWLASSRVLVAVSAVGERRLGERLVDALSD
jgi:hypothetical protein